MKKIFGVFGIVSIILITALVPPTIGMGVEEEDLGIKWKILICIGNIDICLQDKVISGFVLIGYTAGETLKSENIFIKYEGLPLFIFNGLFFAHCYYKPADVSV